MVKKLLARRPSFESLEQRNLLAAQPIISEFVASNDSTINDGFGKDTDWIEIYNAGDEAVDLQGYHLTDDASNATKWSFTAETILNPKEYLVVFASDDNTVDPLGYWHTNFKLSAGGDFVGLADPGGVILSSYGLAGANYPPQVTDVSYGLSGSSTEQVLLSLSDDIQYLVPNNGSLGTSWTNIGFDAGANGFSTSGNGLGYENSPGSSTSFTDSINTSVASGTTTAFIRSEFNLADASNVADLSLAMTYDDGFAVYLNGTYLFGENQPALPLTYNSAAVGGRSDSIVLGGPTVYSLNNYVNLLEDGDNVLAIHALNNSSSSDMLLAAELTAQLSNPSAATVGYLLEATPGAANSTVIDMGPIIDDVEFTPETPGANSPIVVTAEITASIDPVDLTSPKFYYRINFDSEVEVPFVDDGTGADAIASDGVFAAQIPASAYDEGDMVRWYITAEDTDGTLSRAPRFVNPTDSAEYFGTVILDSTASNDLPVMYWFVEDEAAAETREGTRASLFYRGEFYDNVQVDLHGQSTAGPEFTKKSFDFDANKGEKFEIGDPAGKHSDFNLLTNYADQSKLRNTLAYATFAETGGASHYAHPVSVHRNGEFYALYDFVEEGDSEYLRRLGLDPDGAFYKVNNNLEDNSTAAFDDVDKITRNYEDRSDFQEVIDASDLTGSAARTWYFDNLDIADVINYLAVQNLMQNGDFGHKNMYWYRDSNDTKLWQILPWDVDLSYGHNWGNADPPYFNNTLFTTLSATRGWNDIIQNIIARNLDSRLTEMYKRRIQSLSDQILGASGTPASQSWAYQQLQTWDALTADEASQNFSEWGLGPNFTHTPAQAVDQIQNSFIVARRNFINNFAGSQSSVQNISFGTIEYAPTSGNQDEEYIVLTNNNQSFATDISGWTITGAIDHTFKAGTVIPAGETLYVLADVQGFQARTTGPRGGQQLFTQGNYQGRLHNGGGTLTLANSSGAQIDTETYVGQINNGDFDDDGDFDGSDFLAWQRGFGITSEAQPSDGDADQDGKVDSLDLDLWSSNYGSPSSAIAAVSAESVAPEDLSGLAGWSLATSDGSSEMTTGLLVQDVAFSSLEEAPVLAPSLAATSAQVGGSVVDSEQTSSEETPDSLEELVDSVFEQSWG